MYLRKFFCRVFLFMALSSANAQDAKFNDVSIEDLQQTANPIDPEAKAAILNSSKNIYLTIGVSGAQLITEVKMRIKFYDDSEEAFQYATQHVYLYEDQDQERLTKLDGITYNLVDGKIEEAKLKKEGIFEKQLNENLEKISFTLPAVKKGSIIEFEYKKISPYFWDIDELVFQYDIPVMSATAVVYTPDNFLYNRIFKGYVQINETHEEKMDHRADRRVDLFTYHAENIPALKDEKYVDNIKNYRAGVIYELVYVHFLNGEKKQFSVKWEDVAKTLAKSDDYDREMNAEGVFKDDIDALLGTGGDNLKKTKMIFSYVKNNIKWNGYYGKYFYNGMRKAYKEHQGNVADVNLTLVSMLRYAGIRAYPVAISTRDNLKPTFPTLDQLNYVIALAVIDGKAYYMDATEKYSKLNLLPVRDYNWKGVMVHEEEWRLVDLIHPPQSEATRMLNIEFTPELAATGTLRSRYSNHYAYAFRNKIASTSIEDFIRARESNLGNIMISDYKSEHEDPDLGAVKESFAYKYENAVESVGDKLFFSPLLFLAEDENPFKSETRKYPINFGYPKKDKTLVNIKIPEGYSVASLPGSIQLNLAGDLGKFVYLISKNGSFISISMEFEINKAEVHPDQYEFLKGFYDQMIQKQLEKIVLKKA